MKNIILYALLLIGCFQVHAQSTQTNTSKESEDNVNTNNNITNINLFNINFDGQILPINLVYNHNGLKVNEVTTTLGFRWEIEPLGRIDKIVNDFPDQSGWFVQPVLDYSSYSFYDTCQSSCPSNFNTHTPSGDLSPDFFSCKTSGGPNFDFIYKKNYPNNPIPVILSNDGGYKINTNFSNFIDNCNFNSNTVFEIKDSKGTSYEFINGPVLADVNRGTGTQCRNNYYVQTIKNANNTDIISVEYNTANLQKKRYYRTGYNGQGAGSYDFDHNIASSVSMDYYFTDESRLDLKKITSTTATIDFVYLQDGYLDEINVTDIHGRYVTGYKFVYDGQGTGFNFLWQIKKYSVNKTQSEIVYQFEYFNDQNAETLFGFEDSQYEDYFGYCNGIYKDNLFPFDVRVNSTTVKPAGNYTPDINFAKQFSLKKITNKYGGETEFDYMLNFENHSHFGPTYGGGILIQSKREIPLSGTGKSTWYDYQELTGYILSTNSIPYHYSSIRNNTKFFGQIPNLDYINYDFGGEPSLNSLQRQGNFYKRIVETIRDIANPTVMEAEIVSDYVPNYTGLNLTPNLKKTTSYDVYGNIVKTSDFNYTYQTLESVDRATFVTEVRVRQGGTSWYNYKSQSPIAVNRVKIASKTETIFNPDPIENTSSFTYINDNSIIMRSESRTQSNGGNIENKYFYATDSYLSGEPNVSNLTSKNMVGIPLLTQSYKGTEKLNEAKVAYAIDASTNNLLLPKYKYFKKGTDSPSNLFKRDMTFDLYDARGNVLQYTTEGSAPISFIWGYNHTTPIAQLRNVAYSAISSSVISSLQSKSDNDNDNCTLPSCKQEILRSDLISLQSSFPYALIDTWTSDPLVGKTTITGSRGDVLFYEYDEYNRIKTIRDSDQNILSESQYHFFTQN